MEEDEDDVSMKPIRLVSSSDLHASFIDSPRKASLSSICNKNISSLSAPLIVDPRNGSHIDSSGPFGDQPIYSFRSSTNIQTLPLCSSRDIPSSGFSINETLSLDRNCMRPGSIKIVANSASALSPTRIRALGSTSSTRESLSSPGLPQIRSQANRPVFSKHLSSSSVSFTNGQRRSSRTVEGGFGELTSNTSLSSKRGHNGGLLEMADVTLTPPECNSPLPELRSDGRIISPKSFHSSSQDGRQHPNLQDVRKSFRERVSISGCSPLPTGLQTNALEAFAADPLQLEHVPRQNLKSGLLADVILPSVEDLAHLATGRQGMRSLSGLSDGDLVTTTPARLELRPRGSTFIEIVAETGCKDESEILNKPHSSGHVRSLSCNGSSCNHSMSGKSESSIAQSDPDGLDQDERAPFSPASRPRSDRFCVLHSKGKLQHYMGREAAYIFVAHFDTEVQDANAMMVLLLSPRD